MARADRFTTKSREALESAARMAVERGNPEIEVEHLLAAILAEKNGVVANVLKLLEKSPAVVAGSIEDVLAAMPVVLFWRQWLPRTVPARTGSGKWE